MKKETVKVVAAPNRQRMLLHEANRLAQRLAEIHAELQAMHHLENDS